MYYLPFSPFSPDFDAVSVPCRPARNIQKKTRKETAMDTKSSMPRVESSLRHQILKMPEATYEASGIVVNGRRIKSFVFTTDLAIIRNCDADAVFAVYPFTPQQAISLLPNITEFPGCQAPGMQDGC